jgi:hypothetical protein
MRPVAVRVIENPKIDEIQDSPGIVIKGRLEFYIAVGSAALLLLHYLWGLICTLGLINVMDLYWDFSVVTRATDRLSPSRNDKYANGPNGRR